MRSLTLVTCLFSLALLAGCPANNEDNNTDNNQSQDMGAKDMAVDMPTNANNAPATYESDYQLIFTDMVFDKTSPGANLLNLVVRKNFKMEVDYPTIILIDIKDIPEDAGTVDFMVKGGAGAVTSTDGAFEWDKDTPDTYYDGKLNKTSGNITGTFDSFSFIATIATEDEPLRVILPINKLAFDADVTAATEGGLNVSNGKLSGYVTKAQGDMVMLNIPPSTDIVTLTSILKEENLNFDSTGDNTNDAWLLTATFKAKPTTIK